MTFEVRRCLSVDNASAQCYSDERDVPLIGRSDGRPPIQPSDKRRPFDRRKEKKSRIAISISWDFLRSTQSYTVPNIHRASRLSILVCQVGLS